MRLLSSTIASLALAAIALAVSPLSAKAQGDSSGGCSWQCSCEGNACGCTNDGTGRDCTIGGKGCVVTMCDEDQISLLVIAPDGSLVPLPARYAAEREPVGAGKEVKSVQPSTRGWDFVSAGRSVARDCSGLVTRRYYDRAVAADIRKRDQNISI